MGYKATRVDGAMVGEGHAQERGMAAAVAAPVGSVASSPLLLAFDVEVSGVEAQCSVVSLGAVAMHRGQVKVRQRWDAYTDRVHFEPRCFREFWWNKMYLLKAFEVPDGVTKDDALRALITGFQQFRAEWETHAAEWGVPLMLVCDCPALDVGSLNALLQQYTPDKPLPYGASSTQYYRLWDADSLARGWLQKVDPAFTSVWGVDQRMEQLLPHLTFPQATHFPDADAERAAFVASVALGLVQ
jgi:hypothetical protein